ncbi:thiamine pyrophosphate-dependent enzyme [Edaphobacter paludis]|uniref:2-oxoisovalerate dehydrogenase subunit alpha n=1 Tax=Edaphobacter paludis TaxID=3035702 RepID=A0AAU7CUI2_9BACT
MSETAPHENPLVPNKKLRQIYTAMVEARLLDEHIAKLQRKAKSRHRLYSTSGQEACRVATALELNPGDLVSDLQVSATMDLLFGTSLAPLLRHVAAVVSGTQSRTTLLSEELTAKRQLPWTDDASDRLKMALGAALAFKTLKQDNIVVAYTHHADLPKRSWNQVLALAAELSLPIIFVVLPEPDIKKSPATNICAKARSAGLPGIPVDVNDAVALYRVAQESIGRARGGDGAVLIECISYRPAGQRSNKIDDPILHMKNFMTGRQVCSEDWADHAGDTFRKNLAASIVKS